MTAAPERKLNALFSRCAFIQSDDFSNIILIAESIFFKESQPEKDSSSFDPHSRYRSFPEVTNRMGAKHTTVQNRKRIVDSPIVEDINQ